MSQPGQYPESPRPEAPRPGSWPAGLPGPDGRPGQPAPGQPPPGQSAADLPTPGQPAPGQPTPDQPVPGQPVPDQPAPGRQSTAVRVRGAVLVLLATAAASAVLGLIIGFIWSAVAPRALLEVQSHGAAYLVHVETTAYVAADGWFCLL